MHPDSVVEVLACAAHHSRALAQRYLESAAVVAVDTSVAAADSPVVAVGTGQAATGTDHDRRVVATADRMHHRAVHLAAGSVHATLYARERKPGPELKPG